MDRWRTFRGKDGGEDRMVNGMEVVDAEGGICCVGMGKREVVLGNLPRCWIDWIDESDVGLKK